MMADFITDISRHIGRKQTLTFRNGLHQFLHYHGLQALLGYRLGKSLQRKKNHFLFWPLLPFGWALYFLISRYIWYAFDIRLKLSAEIGAGLYIGHFGNIHLHECQVGKCCSISQSVHIHPANDGVRPVVGDRVWIGAHAQIVGPYRIDNGSTISAGAVVKRDIPEKTLCLGNPGRVVMRDYDNSAILGLDAGG
jgi:serine O-acetyltransferase